jgi:thiosulfate dehydrogenase
MDNLQAEMENSEARVERLARIIRQLTTVVTILILAILTFIVAVSFGDQLDHVWQAVFSSERIILPENEPVEKEVFWSAPDIATVDGLENKGRIEYGRELIAHTAKYLGPKGMVAQISNGMNCQNCHMDAGTKVFGNNYSAVASTYPKFRERSGTTEDIYKRVNDCFERSLNGEALDTASREMQAIKAYITFLGTNVAKGEKPNGSGLKDLAYLDRAADPEKGKVVYEAKCVTCHMKDGSGQKTPDGIEYLYPPLWGPHSYNDGAGLFRLSNFARYAKNNMPQGVLHLNPLLTDEEAWDVAAYVNSQPRPHIETPGDWPDIKKKPVDHPFGPYADSFSPQQHKYGPFKPIVDQQKTISTNTTK